MRERELLIGEDRHRYKMDASRKRKIIREVAERYVFMRNTLKYRGHYVLDIAAAIIYKDDDEGIMATMMTLCRHK